MTGALGAPKIPRTLACGQNPENWYASRRRLVLDKVGIAQSCQISSRLHMPTAPYRQWVQAKIAALFTHTIP